MELIGALFLLLFGSAVFRVQYEEMEAKYRARGGR